MDFRALRVAFFAVWLPILSFAAQQDCQGKLDQYLTAAERAAWFRFNLVADDAFSDPFLPKSEQKARADRYQSQAVHDYLELARDCFMERFEDSSNCQSAWQSVNEFSSLVGSSLSRTDVLNRDPLPKDINWSELVMEKQQSSAKSAIRAFRLRRNEALVTIASICMRSGQSLPHVRDDYFVRELSDAGVELISERFNSSDSPPLEKIQSRNLSCRAINLDGSTAHPVVNVGDSQALELFQFRLTPIGATLVLQGFGPSLGQTYIFERKPLEWTSSNFIRGLVFKTSTLHVDAAGNITIEHAMPSKGNLLPSRAQVVTYWSCQ